MTIQQKQLEIAQAIKPVVNFTTNPGTTNNFSIINPTDYKIQGVKIQCASCTSILSVTSNRIDAAFLVAKNIATNNQQRKELEEKGSTLVDYNNHFWIFFDDGEVPYIFDNNNILIDNPKKLKIKYDMRAKVVLTK